MKINPLFLVVGGVAAYMLLKPKPAVAAPRGPMVTTRASTPSAVATIAATVATPLISWLTTATSHYTDTSPNVVAPEGWM